MSVARAQREISSTEFTYWLAYWRFSSLDTEGWEQAAMISASIAASVGAKNVRYDDFMPTEKVQQTSNDMIAVMEAFCGGK